MLTGYGVPLIPGTVPWLLEHVDLRVQLDLRDELRAVRAGTDAVLAVVWVADVGQELLLEHAGDRRFAPVRYPEVVSSIPSFETVSGRDGDEHVAVVQAVRLGRGMPRLALAAIGIQLEPPTVFDLAEEAGARIERLLVKAVMRSPQRRRC